MSGGGLRVEVLGAVRAFAGDEEIDLGPPKQQAVLAALALGLGTAVSRLDLVSRVWGGSAPATAGGSVHTYVSGLRRALGPAHERLVSGRHGYLLRLGRADLDAARAEDLAEAARGRHDPVAHRRATAAWGPAAVPLAGLPGPYAEQTRRRLTALRLRALVEHAENAERADLDDLTGRLLAEVPGHPFDERLRAALMRVLGRCGRTGEALSQFEDLRHGLAADLGVEPSPATRAVFEELLAGGRVAAEPVRPAQLPPEHAGFVGRAEQLRALARGPRLAMIVGVGGIGKTALAVRAGHLLRDRFPDGQLHLNLRGFDPAHAALTPDAALRQLLSSLGVRRVPDGHAERVGLWRSLLADRRVLLVLDDARSAEQVEDLLPGGGSCAVVVTSRNRLAGLAVRHAGRRIALGALSADESLELLGAAVGPARVRAEPEAARRLAELCDRSPFALQIAAEQVASGAPIAGLVARLEDARHRLDGLQLPGDPRCSVRAVLSGSAEALDPVAGQAFRLLGVFPGSTVTRPAAAALFGTGLAQAGALLETLTAGCLLERDGERFRLRDLTRVYAAELSGALPRAQRRAALCRVLSWTRQHQAGL